jgi:four helix bundle protein
MAQEFLDLMAAWQKAIELSECVYKLTKTFPEEELNSLTLLLWQSSITVGSNIGMARGYDVISLDVSVRFLCMAQVSTNQVHTQLLQAKRLKIGDEGMLRNAEALCSEISNMLCELITSLGKKS